jgi:hypothetical protein
MNKFKPIILATFSLAYLLTNSYSVKANEIEQNDCQSKFVSRTLDSYFLQKKNHGSQKNDSIDETLIDEDFHKEIEIPSPNEKVIEIVIQKKESDKIVIKIPSKNIKEPKPIITKNIPNVTFNYEIRSKRRNQKNIDNILTQLEYVPDYFQSYFNKMGGKIYICDGKFTDIKEIRNLTRPQYYSNINEKEGIYFARKKLIAISQNSSANYHRRNTVPLHEVGHAILAMYNSKSFKSHDMDDKVKEKYARKISSYLISTKSRNQLKNNDIQLYTEIKFMIESFKNIK